MPFDGTPPPRPPRDPIAARSAHLLGVMECALRPTGRKWGKGAFEYRRRFCLMGPLMHAREVSKGGPDRVPEYLAAAIRPYRRRRKEDTLRRIVVAYNDERRRSFAEVAAIIAKAKALAEADAGQPPRGERPEGYERKIVQAIIAALASDRQPFERFQICDRQPGQRPQPGNLPGQRREKHGRRLN
jgi:hypothetical protein